MPYRPTPPKEGVSQSFRGNRYTTQDVQEVSNLKTEKAPTIEELLALKEKLNQRLGKPSPAPNAAKLYQTGLEKPPPKNNSTTR